MIMQKGSSTLSFLGVIIAIVALVLAWMAFDRTTSYELDERIEDETEDVVETTGEGLEDAGHELQQ